MLKHFFTLQFLTFIFVGVTAASVNWTSRYVMATWISFSLAVPLAYCVGMATAFILNKKLVFPKSDIPVDVQVRRFVIINLSFLPVVWAGSLIFSTALKAMGIKEYSDEIGHAASLALPMLATFLLYKFVAFKVRANS